MGELNIHSCEYFLKELTKLTDLVIGKINRSLIYLFSYNTDRIVYYERKRGGPPNQKPKYYKHVSSIKECRKKFLYDEHILVDVDKNKYYFSIIPFELYIDVKDVINRSENFDIYEYSRETDKFVKKFKSIINIVPPPIPNAATIPESIPKIISKHF